MNEECDSRGRCRCRGDVAGAKCDQCLVRTAQVLLKCKHHHDRCVSNHLMESSASCLTQPPSAWLVRLQQPLPTVQLRRPHIHLECLRHAHGPVPLQARLGRIGVRGVWRGLPPILLQLPSELECSVFFRIYNFFSSICHAPHGYSNNTPSPSRVDAPRQGL